MRLIDADALLNDISDLKKSPWFHENYFDHKSIRKEAIEIVEQLCIDKAPTIDAVPLEQYQSMEATCVKLQKAIADTPQVVRCKDCRYYQDNNNGYPHNECRWRTDETPDETDFCSFGEREGE